MKFLLDGEVTNTSTALGITAGSQCDEVVFNHADIAQLVKARPEVMHEWIASRLLCRFVPGNKEHRK